MSESIQSKQIIERPPTDLEIYYNKIDEKREEYFVETQRHRLQVEILVDTLYPWLEKRTEGFIGSNIPVFYNMRQLVHQDLQDPDFFVVLDVPKGERGAWVVWNEIRRPSVIIEILSGLTQEQDKSYKKDIYQNNLQVGEYFWFDPFNPDDWAGFVYYVGVYRPITPNSQNQLVSNSMQLALTRWEGAYRDIHATWLRWITLDGELLPTSQETIEVERQHLEQERIRAEKAESQLKTLVTNLVQAGTSIEDIANLTNLTLPEVEKLLN
jgi:Uma2 family endonuclease